MKTKYCALLFLTVLSFPDYAQNATVKGIVIIYYKTDLGSSSAASGYKSDTGSEVYLFKENSETYQKMAACWPDEAKFTERKYLAAQSEKDSLKNLVAVTKGTEKLELSRRYYASNDEFNSLRAVHSKNVSKKVTCGNEVLSVYRKQKSLFDLEDTIKISPSNPDFYHDFVDGKATVLFEEIPYGTYGMLVLSNNNSWDLKYEVLEINQAEVNFRLKF